MTIRSYQSKTSAELRRITHENIPQFVLNIGGDQSTADTLHCSKILRCLPGKRLSCEGEWRRGTVFAKLFIDPDRAKVHWQKDIRGIRALMEKKILTPPLIHSSILPDGGGFYCLFEYFPGAKNSKDLWDAADTRGRIRLLHRLTKLLARHHAAGITQKDLNLNNFLVVGNAIHTLDGAEIHLEDHPLALNPSFKNLAALFAQFFPENDENIMDALRIYGKARDWEIIPEYLKIVQRLTVKKRQKRKIEFLKKTKRECGAFVVHRKWNRLAVCGRKINTEGIKGLIADPDRSIARGKPVKIGNTSTVASIMIDGQRVLIKRYNIKNWKHALNRAFRSTRAFRSWTNAHRLGFYGINTPKPIAFVEERWGPLRRKAYYMSEYCSGDTSFDFFHNPEIEQNRKLQLAEAIVEQLKKLRTLKISHGDLKASNILISGDQVTLIDLDSMKEHTCSCSFEKAWKKDIKRFLKNWSECESVLRMFKMYLDVS